MSYNKNATCRFEKQKIISQDEDEFEMQEVNDEDDSADQEDPYQAYHSRDQQPNRQKIEILHDVEKGDDQAYEQRTQMRDKYYLKRQQSTIDAQKMRAALARRRQQGLLRGIAEVNSELEQSSMNRMNTLNSGLMSSEHYRPSGDGSSGGNKKTSANNQPQQFEPACYKFSPVTSDSGDPRTCAGASMTSNPPVELKYQTSETPCATEESNPIDTDMVEFFESTPRKKSSKSMVRVRAKDF